MPRLRWRQASFTVRLFVTVFYLAMCTGYVIALANAHVKTGGTLAGLAAHYRGAPDGSHYPVEPEQLVEVAHAHGFSVPIMYLILGGLFLGTDVREPWKRVWMLAPFAGVLIDEAVPWLIRYQAAEWAWVMAIGHGVAGVAFLVLVGVPLWDMWGPARGSA